MGIPPNPPEAPEGDAATERIVTDGTGDPAVLSRTDTAGLAPAGDSEGEQERAPRSALAGRRLVLVIAAVAVGSLLAGIALMQFIVSPAELAARTAPPKSGLITLPVEHRTIENTVLARAEVGYADAVEVTIDDGGSKSAQVVTGMVPKDGDEFHAGDVALEISGRPVIVLAGELPVYRTLGFGASGPDVTQLKAALNERGIAAGNLESNEFDADTAHALTELYRQAGYTPPVPDPDAGKAITQAATGVRTAQQALGQAQSELARAREGTTRVEKLTADNAVRDAERAIAQEHAKPTGEGALAGLEDALALARASRDAAYAGPDVSAEERALSDAQAGLTEAQSVLTEAQQAALPNLPSSEVLFLSDLPRRVDAVNAKRGQKLSGAAMSVSGAKLVLTGSVSEADAGLLRAGTDARFPGPDGKDLTAKITAVAPQEEQPTQAGAQGQDGGRGGGNGGGDERGAASERFEVRLEPQDLSPEQVTQLRGTNVRVTIPVAATAGEVLAVPLAALTAGSSGESRVEVVTKEARAKHSEDPETVLVTVQVGLAANGYAEVSSADPLLAEGTTVVVGR